jgi:hypothetical protein
MAIRALEQDNIVLRVYHAYFPDMSFTPSFWLMPKKAIFTNTIQIPFEWRVLELWVIAPASF